MDNPFLAGPEQSGQLRAHAREECPLAQPQQRAEKNKKSDTEPKTMTKQIP